MKTCKKKRKRKLLPSMKTLMALKTNTKTNNWTPLKKQLQRPVKFRNREKIRVKFQVNQLELESALKSEMLEFLLQVPTKTLKLLSLNSFLTRERSSSNMNSTRKKPRKKLQRIRNFKESQALVPDNISLILTTFLVVTRTPRDTPLVSEQSKSFTLKGQSISNTENSKLQAPATTNQKNPTLNQNLRTRWTPTGAEKTVTGVICQGKTPAQVNTTTTLGHLTDMLITHQVTNFLLLFWKTQLNRKRLEKDSLVLELMKLLLSRSGI